MLTHSKDLIGQAVKDLIKAKREMQPIHKNRIIKGWGNNPDREYADLDAVINAIEDALLANNFVLLQPEEAHEPTGKNKLKTILLHVTGVQIDASTWIVDKLDDEYDKDGKIRVKNFRQEYGKSVTYQRRYSILSLLGLCAEDDNDGETGPTNTNVISDSQARLLEYECKNHPKLKEEILKKYSIKDFAAITRDKFNGILEWVQKNKQ
jgi:hypothetical protein